MLLCNMIVISHKAKQFLLVLAKVLIVSLAFFYIYNRLQTEKEITLKQLIHFLNVPAIAILFLFSLANWSLEILKWKTLVSSFKTISFKESVYQTLGSLTASVFTPNRIGEYGAKALYFPKEKVKKIVFLNFIHNSSQMLVTTLFGTIGLLFLFFLHDKNNPIFQFSFKINNLIILLVSIVLLVLFFIYGRKMEIYGFSIEKLLQKFNALPSEIRLKTFIFSLLRYLVFSHQFFFCLFIFHTKIDYPTALITIFSMYFLASIIPSIHLMDVAVKGSVAIYLFNTLNIESEKIISVTLLMWIFNLVFPVIWGSYFVLRFKPKPKQV